jgi:hypothetical protein
MFPADFDQRRAKTVHLFDANTMTVTCTKHWLSSRARLDDCFGGQLSTFEGELVGGVF